MVSRKALIIGSPDEKIPGVKVDVKALNDYLKSPIGGLWFDFEIMVLMSPSTSTLRNQISQLKLRDYSLVFFGGHGYYSAERKRNILKINPNEEFDSLELRAGAIKHTLILDCCRKVESERRLSESVTKAMTLDSVSGQTLNPSRCRSYFDQAISQCDNGLVVMNACSIGEVANENDKDGGYYTSSLIDANEQWARRMLSTVNVTNSPSTFSTQNSHNAATERVRLLSGGRQTPSFEAPRAERRFPFTVVA